MSMATTDHEDSSMGDAQDTKRLDGRDGTGVWDRFRAAADANEAGRNGMRHVLTRYYLEPESRQTIDDVFVALCGWTLPTLVGGECDGKPLSFSL
jgi:hypothetical protein